MMAVTVNLEAKLGIDSDVQLTTRPMGGVWLEPRDLLAPKKALVLIYEDGIVVGLLLVSQSDREPIKPLLVSVTFFVELDNSVP